MHKIFILILVIILLALIFLSSLSQEGFQNEFKNYITVKLQGGLANRIFMMLAVKGFAEKTNRIPVFSSEYNKHINNSHQSEELTFNELKEVFPDVIVKDDISWSEIVHEDYKREFQYQDDIIEKFKDNVVIQGIFQNEKYFPSTLPVLQKTLKPDTVFLHIRLGDYVGTRHDVGLTKYYVECITRLKDKDKAFLVFSNDNTKADEYIKSLNIAFNYTISDKVNALDVLKEMASCSDGICSNSTLSWLGGLFQSDNRGIIYMPGKWINDVPKENFSTFYPSWATVVDV